MKNIFLSVVIFNILQMNSYAIHNLIFRNAGDITSGTLGNERVDTSSITKRGQLNDANQTITLASMTVAGTVTSTGGFIGNGGGLTNISGAGFGFSVIRSSHLVNGAVRGTELSSSSVESTHIADGSITNADISKQTISSNEIGFNVILSTNIGQNTILNDDIAGGTILGGSIGQSTILGTNISSATNVTITSITVRGTLTSTNSATASLFISTGSRLTSLLNCDTVDTDASGNLICGTDATGGGGGTSITTFTYVLSSGGDAVLSTTGFVAIPGAFTTIGKSTWNVREIQAFNMVRSTAGSSQYQLALSTVTSGGQVFRYISPAVEVSTDNIFSTWTSTSFPVEFNQSLALHITFSSAPASALLPAEYGMKIKFWRQPE